MSLDGGGSCAPSQVNVICYDVDGTPLDTPILTDRTFSIRSDASGVYFCRVVCGSGSSRRPFLFQSWALGMTANNLHFTVVRVNRCGVSSAVQDQRLTAGVWYDATGYLALQLALEDRYLRSPLFPH